MNQKNKYYNSDLNEYRTESKRETLKEERNRKIIDLYLKAENTQQSIAEMMDIDSERTVANIVNDRKNRQMSKFAETFQPFLYNIWNTPKKLLTFSKKMPILTMKTENLSGRIAPLCDIFILANLLFSMQTMEPGYP